MFKKSLVSLIAISVLILSGCGKHEKDKKSQDQLALIKQKGEIVVGVKYDAKPFGYVDVDGNLKGFDIDLAQILAKKILGNEKRVTFRQVYTHNRISKLNSGEVDMVIATMTITPDRAQVVKFSIPYYDVGQAVMIRKTSSINSIGDLNGRRTFVILGTTAEKNLRHFAPEAIVKGYRTYQGAFDAFEAARGEAITTDDTIIAGFIQDHHKYKMLPQRYTKEGYAIAFRKDPSTDSLKADVDNIITNMRKNGEMNALKHKWLPQESDKKFKNKIEKRRMK